MNELMKRPHAAIVHLPMSLYPVSLVFAGMFRFMHDGAFLVAAFWCFMFAAIATLPVSLTGALDMWRLKAQSFEGHRLLKMHYLNGIAITLFSVIAGVYFLLHSPLSEPEVIPSFIAAAALLSVMVLGQGLIAAIMIYQHHIGIDGETR